MKEKTKRVTIPKSVRFEIFKRDAFTCQYCGLSSPKVVLEIEHITPVSKGGTNDLINLCTSCFDCNRSKSNKLLTDKSKIERQQNEVSTMAEKLWQFQMYKKFVKDIQNFNREELDLLIEELDPNNSDTEYQISKAYKKFGYIQVKNYFEYWELNCGYRRKNKYAILSLSSFINKKIQDSKLTERQKLCNYITGIIYNKYGYISSNKFKVFFAKNKCKISNLRKFKDDLQTLPINDPALHWNELKY